MINNRPVVISAAMILVITLVGVVIGSLIDRYLPEAVDATVTTEFISEATDAPIGETEASVETAAVTEPVTTETTLPLETTPDITEPPVEETMAVMEVTVEPVYASPKTSNRERNIELLACVIYQEAGGDDVCDDCRYRVADVVFNRVGSRHFPDTIYEVLTQEGQYGRLHWTGVVWPERAENPGEREAVERAYRVARDVLDGNHSELYGKGYIWQAGFVQGKDNIYCCGHYFGR